MRKPKPYTMDAKTYEVTLSRLGTIWASLTLPVATAEAMLAYAMAPAWGVYARRYIARA